MTLIDRMTRKIKIMIGAAGALILIAGLAIVLIILRRPSTELKSPPPATGQPERVKVEAAEIFDSILTGGEVNRCRELKTVEAQDDCFSFFASLQLETGPCLQISDETGRASCRESALLAKIRAEEKWNDCKTITEEAARLSCLAAGLQAGMGEAFCNGLTGDDRAFCLDRFYLQEGVADTPTSCEKIQDQTLAAECRHAAVAPPVEDTRLDADNDGLTDHEETERYGTDPENPDTDGDGFSDGDEIKAGYNPKGPGRL